MIKALLAYIDAHQDKIIRQAQEMVRIPSPTFHEGELAAYLEERLSRLGLETFVNALGDVTGVAAGDHKEALFLLNTHLDQAAPGEMQDPFSGKIEDGERFGVPGQVIYGRGVNGQKASLAAMLGAAEATLALQVPLQRGFAINAGVLEECGGHLSPMHLLEVDRLPVVEVLCAEHTNMRVVNRQRGMIHLQLQISGVGAHAASPEDSSSALAGAARVLLGLEALQKALPGDPTLGRALASLNKLEVIPNIPNMIPDLCHAVIDIRQPASVSRSEIVGTVQEAVSKALSSQAGLAFQAGIEKRTVRSYTGLEAQSDGCMYPFFTSEEEPLVRSLRESVRAICGTPDTTELWSISSEAGYFSTVAGLPVVAFGPGEDRFTHNQEEHVRVEDLILCAKVFAAMIFKRCAGNPET